MSVLDVHHEAFELPAEQPFGVEQEPAHSVEAEVEDELRRAVPQGFAVRCAQTAGWVVRRIRQARAYQEQVKLWAEVERRRAEAEEGRLLYLFGGQLEQWTEAEVAKLRGRRKSVALPGGTLGFRATPTRINVQDESLVMDWAKKVCPNAVVVTERLLKTPINEHFEQTGEVPPGVIVVPAGTSFYVR